MARARSIKPGFFKNESLAELPLACRVLFAGLWTLADRSGRLEDRPKRIHAEIFPYEKYPVDKLLNLLHDAGFILRYTTNGDGYIQITTWDKHQNPHVKEATSTIPAPVKTSNEHRANTVLKLPEPCNLNPEPCNSSSSFLNPEPSSGNPVQNQPRKIEKGDDDDKTPVRKFESDAEELAAVVLEQTGEPPDRRLLRHIIGYLEPRGFTIRQYLDDIAERIPKLKKPPSAGFFHDHARLFGTSEQEAVRVKRKPDKPCCKRGTLPDGTHCGECDLGKELRRVDVEMEREKQTGKTQQVY